MNTFLLYWNPYFSSYKPYRFTEDFDFEGQDCLDDKHNADSMAYDFNWSVVEHNKAHAGDRFFFIRVGYEKPTGLIGSGYFTSEPYQSDDWSGQGRVVFYMDMEFDKIVNPASDKVLSTEDLKIAIPEIEWTRGRAGVMVSMSIAQRLETLWNEHFVSVSKR